MLSRYLFLLASLLLALAAPARAQLLWQQVMGTAAFDETSAGFVAVPGGYLNVGKGGGDRTSANLPNKLYLSKVDAAGTVLWQKSPSLASRNVKVFEVQGVAADATGQTYVVGQCSERVPFYGTPGNATPYLFGLLVKLSATGDTLWTKVLHSLNQSGYSRAVVTPDGSVVVIGYNDLDQFVTKFSPTGQELWRRLYPYDSNYSGFISSLSLLNNGNFLIRQFGTGPGFPPGKYLVLDGQGQLLATKQTKAYLAFFSMRLDASGNVLDGAGRFYKVAPTGDTLFSRQYWQYGRKVEARIAVETPGGQYLVGGQRSNGVDYDVSLLLVSKTDGTVLRDTLLVNYGSDDLVTGLHCDAQGNYLIGGSVSDNGPIGKADQFAFLLRKWDRYLPTKAAGAALAGYSLYPNPAGAGEFWQVSTPTGAAYAGAYELRDALGRLVRQGPALPPGGLPTAALPPGLYLLRVQGAAGWLPALKAQLN